MKLQRTTFNNIRYLLIWTFPKSIPPAQYTCLNCKMYSSKLKEKIIMGAIGNANVFNPVQCVTSPSFRSAVSFRSGKPKVTGSHWGQTIVILILDFFSEQFGRISKLLSRSCFTKVQHYIQRRLPFHRNIFGFINSIQSKKV